MFKGLLLDIKSVTSCLKVEKSYKLVNESRWLRTILLDNCDWLGIGSKVKAKP